MILLLIIVLLIIIYFVCKKKFQDFLLKYFNTKDISKVIEDTELEAENTPKSVSGMENVYKDIILKDFPELNLNELRSMVEKVLLDGFKAIEDQDVTSFSYDSSKAISFINSMINDYKDKNVKFDKIHFHKTILNRYQNRDGIATMYF